MRPRVTRAQLDTMNRNFYIPSPWILGDAELLSLYHFNPSKACLDKLDEIGLRKFYALVQRDPSFYKFMKEVVGIRPGTPIMLEYWLMKNMVAEVREKVYGEPKSDIGNLTTEDMLELSTRKVTDTHLAKLESMDDEDFSVYMEDTNFNKFLSQVLRIRPGFPHHRVMGAVKLWARQVADGFLRV
ncbi:uncharacterized protein FTJAE_5694 [Fusarium tjaetaba]|uniref:Uncharacterized protein n=1 Tax=Fusarium tjaetaba TaxID=1567544 RepID=A0A8H5VXN0_9HYPO|nr:uncharacterized protein FTJAE_5694 [Fusarium tjaetaba]KAF5637279.1 hypothetical protein FTJAE_5694 [Fusarium tjaetaba]